MLHEVPLHHNLHHALIKQTAGDHIEEPDLLWLRGQWYDSKTDELNESVINASPEMDHVSDEICPTIPHSSRDDIVNVFVRESLSIYPTRL